MAATLPTCHPHHFFNALDYADRVVKACAWSDGGCEFFYGDGSVLSFCDAMNTFVALTPTYTAGMKDRRSYLKQDVESTATQEEAAVPMQRDMLFTAWTLTKYTTKVKEALHLYNYYSAQPRLIAGLTKTPCWSWPRRHPIDALVLHRSKHFLERRRIYAKVHAHMVPSSIPQGDGGDAILADIPLNSPATSGQSPSYDAFDQDTVDIPIGVQVTMWCALRRVSLTIHANRTTFSVRWPAPVTQSNGLRSSFIPSAEAVNAAANSEMPFDPSLWEEGNRLPVKNAVQYTWVEQSFPLMKPPAPWDAMLQMALDLDQHTPPDECFREADASEVRRRSTESKYETEASSEECESLYLTLPATATGVTMLPNGGGSALQPCRFSTINPEHAHCLTASGSHVQWATSNRAIHGPAARLLWRYEADITGREPHAVYWCLAQPSEDDETAETDRDRAASPEERGLPLSPAVYVLALVREDESTVSVFPRTSQGFTVQHARCDGSVKVYHVSEDGTVRLPPVVAPVRFTGTAESMTRQDRRRMELPNRSTFLQEDEAGRDKQQGNNSLMSGTVCGDSLQMSHLVRSADVLSTFIGGDGTSGSQSRPAPSAFCVNATGELTDFPLYKVLSQGRYLMRVGEVAMQLATWNESVHRHGRLQRASTSNILLDGVQGPEARFPPRRGFNATDGASSLYEEGFQCRLHPSATSEEVALAHLLDGTAFRVQHDTPAVMTRAAVDGQVVHFLSRVEDIGSFTALTNGVVRCLFDDRTILALIPGPSAFDEEFLLCSCLLRDATQCVVRASKCGPGHPVYRYLAYALPFWRYVITNAVAQSRPPRIAAAGDGPADGPDGLSPESHSTTFSAPRDGIGRTGCSSPAPHSVVSDITHKGERPSFAAPSTSLSIPTDMLEAMGSHTPDSKLQRYLRHAAPDESASVPTGRIPLMHITSWEQTMQDRALTEETERRAHEGRFHSLLDENETIRARNRALLREI